MPATEVAKKDVSPRRLQWLTAMVSDVIDETPRTRTLMLDVPAWPGHRAGQHLDVRLTGDDGYQAQRSYSIASAPEAPHLAITVERIEDGEVSPYLAGDVQKGDKFELRGPIGGYFVWEAGDERPLLLIAGGSGIVPLMAMLRHRESAGSKTPARLLYSSRTAEDIIYKAELERLSAGDPDLKVAHTLTRGHPPGWAGYTRRIDREMVRDVAWPPEQNPSVFICGPTSFVETAAGLLVDAGHVPASIKTERFGATGG